MNVFAIFFLAFLPSTQTADPVWQPSLALHLGYGDIGGTAYSTSGALLGGLSVSLRKESHELFIEAETGPDSSYRHRGVTQIDYMVRAASLRLGYGHHFQRLLVSAHCGYAQYREAGNFRDVGILQKYSLDHRGLIGGLSAGARLTKKWEIKATYDTFLGDLETNDSSLPATTDKFSNLSIKALWRFNF